MKASLYNKNEKTIDNDQVDLKTYQHLEEKLIYLAKSTKPDILFIME